MTRKDAKPFEDVVGERIRAQREQQGWRQDDLAKRARQFGLSWTRASVAAIESGRRKLTVPEFLMLPLLLKLPDLPTLFNGVGDWVTIGPEAAWSPEALRDAVQGKFGTWPQDIDVPKTRQWRQEFEAVVRAAGGWSEYLAGMRSGAERYRRLLSALWPDLGATPLNEVADAEQEAALDAKQETERRAAQRLGVPPEWLAMAARRRWGRSLTAERDARSSPTASPRARGHITSALVDELRPVFESAGLLPAEESEG